LSYGRVRGCLPLTEFPPGGWSTGWRL